MKFLTHRPSVMALLAMIILSTVHTSLGATQLTRDMNEVTVTSRDSNGMPLSITIGYVSDSFGALETSSTSDKASISWSMTEGNEFYDSSTTTPGTLTIDSDTQFTIDLDRNSFVPSVADYTIELKFVLTFNNNGVDFVMDEHSYRFNVNVAGLASTTVVSTAVAVILEQLDPVVSYGDDIVLRATIAAATAADSKDFNVRHSLRGLSTVSEESAEQQPQEEEEASIWLDETQPIIASVDGFDYIWPSDAVHTSYVVSSKTGIPTAVEIILTNVPDSIFDLGSVNVQMPIHYRDHNSNNNSNNSQQDEVNTLLQLVAKVDFESSSNTSYSSGASSLATAVSMMAAAAAGVLLSSIL